MRNKTKVTAAKKISCSEATVRLHTAQTTRCFINHSYNLHRFPYTNFILKLNVELTFRKAIRVYIVLVEVW